MFDLVCLVLIWVCVVDCFGVFLCLVCCVLWVVWVVMLCLNWVLSLVCMCVVSFLGDSVLRFFGGCGLGFCFCFGLVGL